MTFQPSTTLASSKMKAVHAKTVTTVAVGTGNPIPYYIVSGTSGHGITIASNVINLPAGEWTANFAVQGTSVTAFDATIYLNGSSTAGDWPVIHCYGPSSFESDASTASISVYGPCTLELRVSTSVTLTSECDVMIIGVVP